MSKASLYIVAALAALSAALVFALLFAAGAYKAEKSAHALTKMQLEETQKEVTRWAAANAQRELNQNAVQIVANECLKREKAAASRAIEREQAYKAVTAKPVTPQQKAQVVDDKTHQRIVNKLNRPL